jgi:hypothetical protein
VRRDDTPADVAVDDDLSLAELHARADPIVFLVRATPSSSNIIRKRRPSTGRVPSLLTKAFERAA